MKRLLLILGLLALPTLTLAATTFQTLLLGTTTTLITFSSLANNGRTARGTTYDPRQGQTGQGYTHAMVECNLTFSGTPTSGTAIPIWFMKSPDGTNFEDNTTSRAPDVSCPVTPSQAGTRVSFHTVKLPPWRFGATALNDGTGVTLSSGTVSITPYTIQGN